jgi:protein phosphatase
VCGSKPLEPHGVEQPLAEDLSAGLIEIGEDGVVPQRIARCARRTLTICYTVGAAAFIGHVGDSRAYLHRRGAVHQVTRDHTLAQELADAGMPKSETAEFGHILTNVLGGPGGHSTTDVHHFALENGDSLLLCTDGLTDLVTDEEIARTLDSGGDAQSLCRALVGLALERGGADNVTVVLARYDIPTTDADRST